MLPHRFPFLLVDARVGERVRAGVTIDATWVRDGAGLPKVLLIEMLAQAAILLSPETGEGGRGLLAGIDQARFSDRPVAAGDLLEIQVERTGSFGRLAKVQGSLYGTGEKKALLCEASLLLALDG